MSEITIDELADIAHEISITDPIDWKNLNISEEHAYKLMASHIIELDNDPLTLKAICVKLLVENFVLNLKLETKH